MKVNYSKEEMELIQEFIFENRIRFQKYLDKIRNLKDSEEKE